MFLILNPKKQSVKNLGFHKGWGEEIHLGSAEISTEQKNYNKMVEGKSETFNGEQHVNNENLTNIS